MDHLHQVIGAKVREWRERGYPCDEFPAITGVAQIIAFAQELQTLHKNYERLLGRGSLFGQLVTL